MAEQTFTVSDYILTRLKQAGLKHLFAVPGDYAAPFLTTLESFKGIKRIGNVNELDAGYAADGYARFAGIGAVCVQYGVGTFSVLNATAGSYVERVPVVVITGSPSDQDRLQTREYGILFHHSTGNLKADREVFEAVTVAAEIISSAEEAPEKIDRAMTALLTHHRPIYLEVYKNLWTVACERPKGKLKPVEPTSNPDSLKAALDVAWLRIKAAKHPVIWAGVEIQRYGLQDILLKLMEQSGFPFTTTSLGKTVLSEDHPQFIGTFADEASLLLTRLVMAKADCMITLGDIITDDYVDVMEKDFCRMIVSNDEQMRVDHTVFPDVYMKDFMKGLLERFEGDQKFPRKLKLPRKLRDEPLKMQAADHLTYNRFFHQLQKFLKKNDLLSSVELILGESSSLYVFSNFTGLPQNAFVAQAAWGSLGHETGSSTGVGIATGKRPIVVAGDGGFMMMCQTLSTLRTNKINAIVFVMSNHVYAIEQAFVSLDAFKPGGKFAPYDELPVWNYVALAEAFGARGFRVETVGELQRVLDEELKHEKKLPALVEVVIPKHDLAPQIKRLAEAPA
jgi:Pyruvate decarboxylase and related thiamine pyrophosphate-requiring enzymes